MESGKVWFITGCSTGFGRLLAEEALAMGHRVIATARRPESLADLEGDACLTLEADVVRPETLATSVEAARRRFGRIDVVVANAGYGLIGAVEEISDAEARAQFDVNVFGLLNTMRATLPLLRTQRSGHVMLVGSQAGFAANPAFGIYAATKFAVEAIGEASAQELAPLGVHVTIVEPGPFRTDWAGRSMARAATTIPDYDATAGENSRWLDAIDGKQPNDPRRGARAMVMVAEMAEPPLRLPLGPEAFARLRATAQQRLAQADAAEALGADTAYPA